MPKDNWFLKQQSLGTPDYIDEDHAHLFPASGGGLMMRDWIPDPTAEPEVHITPGEEKYGIGWREGDPIPKPKKVKAELDPRNG